MTSATAPDRPSPWKTPFGFRTYLAGALWLAGIAVQAGLGGADRPGWFAVRLDPAGLLYAAASLVGGLNFFGAGIRAARRLRLDMNFLMSVAIVAAILIGEPFEAASLAFLFATAELLERFAVDRARRSVAALLRLAPEQADRLRPDGSTETVPAGTLKIGDRIRVRPGDRIGADGRILAGHSSINEATITGESVPASKGPGAQVYSGTINLDGSLDIEVLADAEHSVVARIVELVRAAEGRRAPVEYFVQLFARVYTPIVTGLAILVAVLPPLIAGGETLEWFIRGVTLLVIACPCALVIATPVTIVSALTSAARHGVLIKGGEHLERLGTVQALATDKTGTLTAGQLAVTEIRVNPAGAEPELLPLLAVVESRSEHPVGKAIVRFAAERGISPRGEVRSFKAFPGQGIRAQLDAGEITAGTERFVGPEAANGCGGGALDPGKSWVFVAVRGARSLSACIGLEDEVRPESRGLVKQLHRLGVNPIVLVSGDRPEVANRVAQAVGIDQVQAGLLPEQKVAAIQDLRARFGKVAMVGDGINDAPALAEASIGIAMGAAGAPAAIETADVALMGDNLARVPYAIGLARRAHRIIRFNIVLAIALKGLLAVGAVTGVVSLAVAVLVGDLGASLVVTANAMRLAGIAARQWSS